MSSSNPIPPSVRKASARKTTIEKPGTWFEYVKFWAPFLLTLIASFVVFMTRIAILEEKVINLEYQVRRLEMKTVGREVIESRFETCKAGREAVAHDVELLEARCLTRHKSQELRVDKVSDKLDRHIELSTYDDNGR